MGERKGQNKYYPPDYDPKVGGLNKFLGTHALRERARKLHMGILIIRFEMPYNIWCEGCGNHVGMGVRYNAEKKKIGMYYTTPIYQFRMKCHLCNNHYIIKTDPANLDYVIESGARRQENRFQAEENGTVVPDDKDTIKRLASDPMFKLDRGDVDVSKAKKDAHPRINKLAQIQDRVKDDYLANRILRDKMRAKRKSAQAIAATDNALLSKSCLPSDLKLLPENEEDARLASLLRLAPISNPEEKRSLTESESIFSPGSSTSFGGKLKNLQKSISAKNGANPFSSPSSKSSSSSGGSGKIKWKSLKIGVKRKISSTTVTSSSGSPKSSKKLTWTRMALKQLLILGLFPLALAMVAQNASELERLFEKFETDFGKKYKSLEERSQRFTNFANNVEEMERFNKEKHSWKKGITKFFDMTEEEFKKTYLNGYSNILQSGNSAKTRTHDIDITKLPTEVDWRKEGAVTKVQDQGMCGSCWAFAALHEMESYVKINGGELKELSAQHLTSCTPNPLKCGGTGGCMGSVAQLAYSYIQLFGLTTEDEYPYTSGYYGQTEDCEFNPKTMKPFATVRGFESLPKNDQAAIMEHVATKGPLAVAVAATDWFSYFGGVFDGCRFDRNIEINHAVQLVGYGTDPELGDYWLVKNSWGEDGWGEAGFIRMKRTSEMECGENNTPLSGGGCVDDGVEVQHVCGQCGILYDTNYPIGAVQL